MGGFDTIMDVIAEKYPNISVKGKSTKIDASLLEGIRGAKVLLVEDNPINQQVARETLKMAGLLVDIANNGEHAIHTLETNTYDIVLMDVQMPVMDGFTATRIIRKEDKYKNIPIIAMTAHAVLEYRDRCLSAGMNDYVAKPINLDQLYAALIKWIKPYKREIPLEELMDIEDKQELDKSLLPDILPGIDMDSGLKRIGGNKKLYKNLLLEIYRDYANVNQEIKKGLERNDIEFAKRQAHTIKGLSGNIGAVNLQAAAYDVEKGIKNNINQHEFNIKLNNFDKALEQVINAIKSIDKEKVKKPIDNISTKDLKQIELNEIAPIFFKLSGMIKESDPAAEEYLENVKTNFHGTKLVEPIENLFNQISNFDFENAQQTLENIAKEIGISGL